MKPVAKPGNPFAWKLADLRKVFPVGKAAGIGLIKAAFIAAVAKHTPGGHDHDQSTHGRRGQQPEWQSVMRSKDAQEWVKGSKYTKTVVHLTSMDSVDGIAATGFNTDPIAGNGIAMHGQGSYFGTDSPAIEAYAEWKADQMISAKVMVKNPLEVTFDEGLSEKLYGGTSGSRRWLLKQAGYDMDSFASMTADQQEMFSEAMGGRDGRAMTRLLREKGYDSVIITDLGDWSDAPGGSQILVFDKEQAVVIAESAADLSIEVPGFSAGGVDPDTLKPLVLEAFAKHLQGRHDQSTHGRRGAHQQDLGPKTAAAVRTEADLRAFAEPLPADPTLFTHAVRRPSELDGIVEHGIQPRDNLVFASHSPLVRERGGGFVVFRADPAMGVEGTDVVEIGLTYPEVTFERAIPASAIVKVVRRVDRHISEDALARWLLENPNHPDVDGIPPEYAKWVEIARGSSSKVSKAAGNNAVQAAFAESVLKHLEGQHDQSSHGRSKGGPKEDVPDPKDPGATAMGPAKTPAAAETEPAPAAEPAPDPDPDAKTPADTAPAGADAPVVPLKQQIEELLPYGQIVPGNHEEAIAVGELVQAEYMRRQGPIEVERVRLKAAAVAAKGDWKDAWDEVATLKAQVAGGDATPELGDALKIAEARVDASRIAMEGVNQANFEMSDTNPPGPVYREILGELRPMGGDMTIRTSGNGQGDWEAAALVKESADTFPSDWLGVANDYEGRGVKVYGSANADGRAFAKGLEIHLDPSNEGLDTARHELAHIVETRSTGIPLTIDNFYEARTAGSELKPLGAPYDAGEVGKADKFFDKYVGKKYPEWGYSEVLSMGTEALFSMDYERMTVQDPEMTKFILGLLAAHK